MPGLSTHRSIRIANGAIVSGGHLSRDDPASWKGTPFGGSFQGTFRGNSASGTFHHPSVPVHSRHAKTDIVDRAITPQNLPMIQATAQNNALAEQATAEIANLGNGSGHASAQ